MGSLMPGWDSPVLKSKSDIYKRSHSLTNDEIEAFWKSLKKLDEKQQHIIDGDTIFEEKTATVNKPSYEKSSTYDEKKYFMHGETETMASTDFMHGETETMASTAHKLADNNGWWTRSNSAFLNESPTIEDPPHGLVNVMPHNFT